MKPQQRIDRLEERIRDFRIDFERFFCGDLPAAPEPLRQEILGEIRQLHSGPQLRSPVDSFRLTQIEARFNSYNEMFNRRTRDLEEAGRRTAAAETAPRPGLGGGVVVVGRRVTPDAVETLYRGLAATGAPAFDLDSFGSYLGRQVAEIRAKTGCEQVQFRLVVEAGKTKLKAKPLTAADGEG